MSTENTPSEGLVIEAEQSFWSKDQLDALRHLGLEKATKADLAIFFHQCKRTGLDPFAHQIYMIGRWDSRSGSMKYTIQTGIDGYRLIADRVDERTGGKHGYEDNLWCGPDGKWVDVWLSPQPPAAAKVTVIRNGQRFPAIATLSEYGQVKKNGDLTAMWQKMPANQLAKCAAALALRMAYPQDLSGLYVQEEMQQASNPAVTEIERAQPSQIEQKTDLPALEQQLENINDVDELRKFYAQAKDDGAPESFLAQTITKGRELKKQAEPVEVVTGEIIAEPEPVFPTNEQENE